MVIFLQYTLTDLRAFTNEKSNLLSRPSWPSPIPFKEFVRGTGQIIARSKQGLNSWVGENYICKITSGIKIKQRIQIGDCYLKNISKHLYSSSKFILTKYEFVFLLKNGEKEISYKLITSIIDSLFEAEVSMKFDQKFKKSRLKYLQKDLIKFHLNATTIKDKISSEMEGVVYSCIPQIYFFLDKDEFVNIKRSPLKLVNAKNQFFKLYGGWFNKNNNPIRLWIHEKKTVSSLLELNRNLRISIMRLHSEFECLTNIFRAIANNKVKVKPKSEESDNLQLYLNFAISTFLTEESNINFQSGSTKFLDYFAELFSIFQPGELITLKKRIKNFNFRPQIEEKTINLIKNTYSTIMNNYEAHNSQIGAMGENAKSENSTFTQTNITSDLDFTKLTQELSDLKNYIKPKAENSQQLDILANVAKAEEAAKNNDGPKVIQYLKTGGQWLLNFAKEISAHIIADIIVKSGGM